MSHILSPNPHDVLVKAIKYDRATTADTTTPEDAAVHVECQMVPLIAGVMNLRMMPQPK
jgi:hypothetical protein